MIKKVKTRIWVRIPGKGVTICPPNKNFVLEISIRREMKMEEITVNDDNMIM